MNNLYDKLDKLCESYWETDEIDVDVANAIVKHTSGLIKRAKELEREVERLRQAMKGAAEVSNIAGSELKRLREENERLRKALEHIKNAWEHDPDRKRRIEMRPIKFRGKRIDNSEWVYGDYCTIPQPNILFVNDKHEIDCSPIDPETVGQFTGLHDKNGTEIYEGDIVKFKRVLFTDCSQEEIESTQDFEGVVIWRRHCWALKSEDRYLPFFWSSDKDEYEVIGNIWEHPHLLRDKEETNESRT